MNNLKKITLLPIFSILSSLFLMGETPIKVLAPDNDKIYISAFPDFGGAENVVSSKRIKDFEALSMKKMAWLPFTQHWFNGMAYPKESIHTIYESGSIPYVRFHPRSTLKQFQKETKFSLINIINGKFDAELYQWAKEAKADKIPFIMDFGLEMNGNWFCWSGALNGAGKKDGYGDPHKYDGAEQYRDAYRHIIDIFREVKVNHVTWFFHPTIMTEPKEAWNDPKLYYPGDDYIDWIGISIYGPFHPGEKYWDTFDEIMEGNYQKIAAISNQKPFAILELGVTDHHPMGKKPQWIKETFESIISKKYLDFKAVTYWHENWDNDGILTSLRIDSSKETLSAFRRAISDKHFTSKVKLSGK